MILATRHGFHGKKGLAGAVTGSETDHERDPRVRFVSFPTEECRDVSNRDDGFDPQPYRVELEALWRQFGRQIAVLITEPYLGGGGSYHPHRAYLQMVQEFCREKDIVFILDEVQSNFGRTGELFAYEAYGLEPDIVVLGKGLGNGVPVAATVGRPDILSALNYGEGSDTWSANPICCAAVLTTLEAFEKSNVLTESRRISAIVEEGLVRLKDLPFVEYIRGEKGGMVWGVQTCDHDGRSAEEWANAIVLACYHGLDHRKISVAQYGGDVAPARPETLERLSVGGVSLHQGSGTLEAEVTLSAGQIQSLGRASGANTRFDTRRIVASATLDAVTKLVNGDPGFSLGELEEVDLGGRAALVVCVNRNQGRSEGHLMGCAEISYDPTQAVIYAVLDAVNRILGSLPPREPVEYEVGPAPLEE